MAAKTKVTEAPFDGHGSLMHFPENRYDYSAAVRLEVGYGWEVPPKVVGPEWRPNVPFAATMRLEGTRRGRSAAYFVWSDDSGRQFPMFLTDMADLIQCPAVVLLAGGVIAASWMVAKRGANYGIRLATHIETAGADQAFAGTIQQKESS